MSETTLNPDLTIQAINEAPKLSPPSQVNITSKHHNVDETITYSSFTQKLWETKEKTKSKMHSEIQKTKNLQKELLKKEEPYVEWKTKFDIINSKFDEWDKINDDKIFSLKEEINQMKDSFPGEHKEIQDLLQGKEFLEKERENLLKIRKEKEELFSSSCKEEELCNAKILSLHSKLELLKKNLHYLPEPPQSEPAKLEESDRKLEFLLQQQLSLTKEHSLLIEEYDGIVNRLQEIDLFLGKEKEEKEKLEDWNLRKHEPLLEEMKFKQKKLDMIEEIVHNASLLSKEGESMLIDCRKDIQNIKEEISILDYEHQCLLDKLKECEFNRKKKNSLLENKIANSERLLLDNEKSLQYLKDGESLLKECKYEIEISNQSLSLSSEKMSTLERGMEEYDSLMKEKLILDQRIIDMRPRHLRWKKLKEEIEEEIENLRMEISNIAKYSDTMNERSTIIGDIANLEEENTHALMDLRDKEDKRHLFCLEIKCLDNDIMSFTSQLEDIPSTIHKLEDKVTHINSLCNKKICELEKLSNTKNPFTKEMLSHEEALRNVEEKCLKKMIKNPPKILLQQMEEEARSIIIFNEANGLLQRQEDIEDDLTKFSSKRIPKVQFDPRATEIIIEGNGDSGGVGSSYAEVCGLVCKMEKKHHITHD